MVSFDGVLPTLLRICESTAGFQDVMKATAVRDLRGRVRLAIRLSDGAAGPDVSGLEAALGAAGALGPWFERPILVMPSPPGDRAARERAQLTAAVLNRNSPWQTAGWEEVGTGARRTPPAGRWHLIEARLSKQSWTSTEVVVPPWPLVEARPALATFYSFKGGVGRTTLLCALAWRLARAGKRVVVVDLDVESPGAGSALGAGAARGLLDILLDYQGTGDFDLEAAMSSADALDADSSSRVDVLGAGRLDASYFEKLARLDFTIPGLGDAGEGSAVSEGLTEVVRRLAGRSNRPDYILFDSRAGLHDVAGLGLHRFAHVDVLVGRASPQAYAGFELTLESLVRRRRKEDRRFLLVHSLVPKPRGSPEAEAVEGEFLNWSHGAFTQLVYDPDGEVPVRDDDDAQHFPAVVRRDESLERPTALANLDAVMHGELYDEAYDRFTTLCASDQDEEGEGE